MIITRPNSLLPIISFSMLLVSGTTGWGESLTKRTDDVIPLKTIKLQFCVAMKDQAMIADKTALLERISIANKIYKNTQIRFEIGDIIALPEDVQNLVTRDDRNSLAEKTLPPNKMIQIFIVHSARDVDKHDAWIAGVHWRYGGAKKAHAKRRFIILSSLHSNNDTLAHELGHWFGLNHVKDENNLMCGTGSRSDTILNEDQFKILHKNLEAALTRKEVETK